MPDSQPSKQKEISLSFKVFITSWAFLENGLFSGLRAGWSALVYILKQEEVYAHVCPPTQNQTRPDNGTHTSGRWPGEQDWSASGNDSTNHTVITCGQQDAIFNQCFTVASATMALSALLYGHLNYKFGIRVPRILSVLIFVAGTCCFAFVNKDVPWLIFPGLLLVSSGGMALYITNNQISYMFSTGSAAVVGLLCGALEASAIVQTIIKILYEKGISLFISYMTLSGLYGITLISTIFFLPKDFISSKSTEEQTLSVDSESGCKKRTASHRHTGVDHGRPDSPSRVMSAPRKGTGLDLANDSDLYSSKIIDSGYLLSKGDQTEYSPEGRYTDRLQDGQNSEWDHTFPGDAAKARSTSSESDQKLQHPEENTSLISANGKKHERGQSKLTEKSNLEPRARVSTRDRSLLKCLLTKTFMLYLFWAVVVQIILSMSLGTFNPWLEYVTNKDMALVSEFTDVLFYSMLGSPLLALLFGLGMDLMKRTPSTDEQVINIKTLHTSTVSLGATSLLGVLVCGLFMVCSHDVIVVTSVGLVLFRTGLYSCGTAFLRIMYPTHYFGILCGIMSVLAGGLSFLQYPLFLWIQYRDQAWMEVFGLLAATGVVSLVMPAYLLWKSRQYKRPSSSGLISDKPQVDSPGIQDSQ